MVLGQTQGLYQAPVDLVSDRFSCPSVFHANFVADMNLASQRMGHGGGAEDVLNHVPESMAAPYEIMARLQIDGSENVAPRLGAQRNSVEHFPLGVLGHVVTIVGL